MLDCDVLSCMNLKHFLKKILSLSFSFRLFFFPPRCLVAIETPIHNVGLKRIARLCKLNLREWMEPAVKACAAGILVVTLDGSRGQISRVLFPLSIVLIEPWEGNRLEFHFCRHSGPFKERSPCSMPSVLLMCVFADVLSCGGVCVLCDSMRGP